MTDPAPDLTVIVKFRMNPADVTRLAQLAPTGVGVGPYARSIILDHLTTLTATPATEPKDTP